MELKIFHKGFNYSQDGCGNRLVYHLQRCNLDCPWCANPEGMDADGPETAIIKNEDIYQEVMRSRSMFFDGGGVTFTGGEATCQFTPLKDILTQLHQVGISTALETNGTSPRLPELFPVLNELIMDFKHHDSAIHKKVIGMGNETIQQNVIRAFREHPNVLIRIPLIGGFNDSEEDMERFVAFFTSYNVENVRFELLRYHEYGKDKWEKCGKIYTVKDAHVSENTRIKFENMMRMNGLNIVRT